MRTRRHGGLSYHPRHPRHRRPLYRPTSCRSTSPHILPRLPRPFRQPSVYARQSYRKFTNQRRVALTMMSRYWVLVGLPHLSSPPLPPLHRLSPSSPSSIRALPDRDSQIRPARRRRFSLRTKQAMVPSIGQPHKGRQRVQCVQFVHQDRRSAPPTMTRGLRSLSVSMLPARASSVRPAHSSSSYYRLHFALQIVEEVLVPDLGSDKIWRLAQEGSTWEIKGSIDYEPERNVLCRGWLDQISGQWGTIWHGPWSRVGRSNSLHLEGLRRTLRAPASPSLYANLTGEQVAGGDG